MAKGQFNAKGQAAPERQNLCSNLGDQSFLRQTKLQSLRSLELELGGLNPSLTTY